MSDERVRAVMVRYYEEIWNQGRLEVCDELIAPDYVNHSAPLPGLPPGPGGLKQIVATVRATGPHGSRRISSPRRRQSDSEPRSMTVSIASPGHS